MFDSGVGGLTVLRALERHLPRDAFLYVGDTARVPWGTKGPDTVQRYSVRVARHLVDSGCRAIVIACNTASAFALEAVRAAVSVPVIDVITPVAVEVARALAAPPASARHVAVLGTRGTVASHAYPRALAAIDNTLITHQRPCPLFVPLVEEGWVDGAVPEAIARTYLDPLLRENPPDALILGCTHYPMMSAVIARVARAILGRDVPLFESGDATANALAELLGAPSPDTRPVAPSARLQVTDSPELFLDIASRFLGRPVDTVEHIDLAG